MAQRREVIDLTNCQAPDATPRGLFIARCLERGTPEVRNAEWATSAQTLDVLGRPVLRVAGEHNETGLYELDDVLAVVALYSGRLYVSVAAEEQAAAEIAVRALREKFPVPDPSSAHEVSVTFWTYGPHGPQPAWRTIAVPEWGEISGNYAASTREGLERVMRDFEPAHGGQLVLWHGKAGTGKTFALRALAWEWRQWCDFQYIVDPDAFFGQHADYLMNVLLAPGFEGPGPRVRVGPGMPFDLMFDEDEEAADEKPWRLLILEDTGELLTPDAKSVIGQGLSRFLNVVDGLIGQGLRVLVLVTTNEPIRSLHPAVARPGRCAANVEFVSLSRDESVAWLREHGSDEVASSPQTLASLYARLQGMEVVEAEQAAGFAGAARS